MPVQRRAVIREGRDRTELPEWLREGALLQQWLAETGRWADASQWLRVYRHVGYSAMDVAGFFLHYFASGQHGSLKEFGARSAPWRTQLAALGHRREFPTPSSVSRLLGVVALKDVRPSGARLLLETADAAAMLQHPAAAVTDTFAEPWHIFDIDATVQAFRERALPRGAELPEPRRRIRPALARPGYAGRKRGDLRCSRGTVQHAGTGLWVGLVLSPERADGAAELPPLLDTVELACQIGGLPRERALVRADGAGGNVPWLTVCQARGLPYLTRWGHYSLLKQADVQQQLAGGPWYRVASAGSGPQREALDLGEFEFHAGPQTRDAAGNHYEPVRSRVVVSRFRADHTHSNGRLIDGWVYELFATGLPAPAWPAAETVALYFGRAAEENRFAQEDRELGLDHLFSYHLPGQELACLLGLMVWNLRLTQGFAQNVPPTMLSAPVPRLADPVPPPGEATDMDQRDPVSVSKASSQNLGEATALALVQAASALGAILEVAPTNHVALEMEPSPANPTSSAAADDAARTLFDELDWSRVLAKLGTPWARAPGGDGLTCPSGSTLSASLVVPSRHRGGQPSLRLLASVPACRSCSQRSACTQTDAPQFAKSVSVPVTSDQGERLRMLLAARKRSRQSGPHPSLPPPPAAKPAVQHASPRHKMPVRVPPSDSSREPGPYAPSETRLLPSEFRHAFGLACRQVAVKVVVPLPLEPGPSRPIGLALTAGERQHRRRTWHARLLDNELPAETEVAVLIEGPGDALVALGLRPTDDRRDDPIHRVSHANL